MMYRFFYAPLKGAKNVARKLRDGITLKLLLLSSRHLKLSQIYYGLLNKELSREMRAVAAGRYRFQMEKMQFQESNYLLRRNIHRLEKGMIMKPRRSSFGSEYIGQTVSIYAKAIERDTNEEILWAHDVLRTYFAIVDCSPEAIRKAETKWKNLRHPEALPQIGSRIPFTRVSGEFDPNVVGSIESVIEYRRSVRWYENAQVDREIIDYCIRLAGASPTACNRQPYVFHVIDSPDKAREFASIPGGTGGFANNVPALAIVVGQLRAYPKEWDRHAIYIDASLAIMTFVYALESKGLASCIINWPDREPYESKLRSMLKLADDERVVAFVAFGYPDRDGMVPRSTKKDLSQLRVYL